MDKLLYKSTRGNEGFITASEAIIKGISEDGGLFVPTRIPKLMIPLKELAAMDYKELAYNIMKDFLQDFTEEELRECIAMAYDDKFDTPEIAPLVKKAGVYFLELFHGPTLAFKDMALSLLPHLMKCAAKKQKLDKEIVILTATSGDTGKAALEGFADVPGTRIVVFFPEDGVSEIQKRQMTTTTGRNTYVVGIRGNFDDAQSGVKKMFTDEQLQKRLTEKGLMFSSANSINIGRLIPQIAYYFHAYAQLCNMGEIAPGDEINFTVPTGNFGNILAGYYAKCMGLPVRTLMCASNENKVLYDFMNTGTYDKKRSFVTTMSPSMDILISSNLERLLFSICGDDGEVVGKLMHQLAAEGEYKISDFMHKNLKGFYGGWASEAETVEAIREVYKASGYIIDTHTAVAYSTYKQYMKQNNGEKTKTVIISTASPYKFTTDVMLAISPKYAELDTFELLWELCLLSKTEIPEGIKELDKKPVLHKTVCAKNDMQGEVERILGM
ncbi:MAG TPA: threonine synthase [Negativicutes bacterium]|nr:threonine synthase [Negativicutes bacterium]